MGDPCGDFTFEFTNGLNQVLCWPFGAENELAVSSRSMLQIMQVFASRLDVPEDHLKDHSAWPSPNNARTAQGGEQNMRIFSSKQNPTSAFAAVRYRDYWFWVDNGDLQTKWALIRAAPKNFP